MIPARAGGASSGKSGLSFFMHTYTCSWKHYFLFFCVVLARQAVHRGRALRFVYPATLSRRILGFESTEYSNNCDSTEYCLLSLESMEEPKDKLKVYLDNSNLWIEGKKAYARMVDLAADEDPRWRVDIKRLLMAITGNRRILQSANLYGSVPPPGERVFYLFSCRLIVIPKWTVSGKLWKNKM